MNSVELDNLCADLEAAVLRLFLRYRRDAEFLTLAEWQLKRYVLVPREEFAHEVALLLEQLVQWIEDKSQTTGKPEALRSVAGFPPVAQR